jgi:hypothetical protein
MDLSHSYGRHHNLAHPRRAQRYRAWSTGSTRAPGRRHGRIEIAQLPRRARDCCAAVRPRGRRFEGDRRRRDRRFRLQRFSAAHLARTEFTRRVRLFPSTFNHYHLKMAMPAGSPLRETLDGRCWRSSRAVGGIAGRSATSVPTTDTRCRICDPRAPGPWRVAGVSLEQLARIRKTPHSLVRLVSHSMFKRCIFL